LPYVNTTWTTYALLGFLLVGHLGANLTAVRGLTMKTLNRQRACIAWSNFRALERGPSDLSDLFAAPRSVAKIVGMNRLWRRGLVASGTDLEG
jgi:hypothetical protein